MARPRSSLGHGGRPGDTSAHLGGVHGPELVARGRAARVAAGHLRREEVVAMMQRSLAEGRADMTLLHHRTVELIDAGYAGGDAPGAPLVLRGLGGGR